MQVKTSELEGLGLDYAVAACTGSIDLGGGDEVWCPSEDWSQGGPIIEQMRGIKLKSGRNPKAPCYAHIVGYNGVERWHQTGKTLLIAAMRCYVSSKLGDVVDIPDELV